MFDGSDSFEGPGSPAARDTGGSLSQGLGGSALSVGEGL